MGPRALFRAVVDGGVRGPYWEDQSAPWGLHEKFGVFPVRFEFTKVQNVDDYWFTGSAENYAFRTVLDEVYFKSLFVLKPTAKDTGLVQMGTVLGTTEAQGAPPSEPTDRGGCGSFLTEEQFGLEAITSPDVLEDRVGNLFRAVGFRVVRLGHNRPYQCEPDGLGSLPKSLLKRFESLGKQPYFVLWDCKFSVSAGGLRREEERALKEYATKYAERAKGEADAPAFWFLLIGKEHGDAEHMRATADMLANDDEVRN